MSADSSLVVILNKVKCRCFCVLTSIKSGLQFDVNLEMDKKCTRRHQEAEKVPTETLWTIVGPKSKSRGAQHQPEICPKRKKNERHH